MAEKSTEKQKIQIVLPESKKTGTYSNAVSVSINDNEVILDFGYIIPGSNHPTIEVVSRVNMGHKSCDSFLNVLQNAMLDYKNKNK